MKVGFVYKYADQEKEEWIYELRCDKEMLKSIDDMLCSYLSEAGSDYAVYTTKELEEINKLSRAVMDIRAVLKEKDNETDSL